VGSHGGLRSSVERGEPGILAARRLSRSGVVMVSRGGGIRRKALLVTAERKLRYRTRLNCIKSDLEAKFERRVTATCENYFRRDFLFWLRLELDLLNRFAFAATRFRYRRTILSPEAPATRLVVASRAASIFSRTIRSASDRAPLPPRISFIIRSATTLFASAASIIKELNIRASDRRGLKRGTRYISQRLSVLVWPKS
jgi:hypothetical protein